MTSANQTYYDIFTKDGKFVDRHSQNSMCKFTVKERLKQHQPPEDYILILCWPDENEAPHYTEKISLADYLNGKKVVWKAYEY